ncbi:hypothetical protein [Rhodanobacter umsongensis]
MDEALRDALAAVVPDLHRCCRDPWTLIGSAAARLVGADVSVADLDVLTSTRDAEVLTGEWWPRCDDAHVPDDPERFRSRYARFHFPGLPVEVMGGLELFGKQGWVPVQAGETETVDMYGVAVTIPTIVEQLRIMQSFGRPKDLRRAALLKPLCGEQS